jgi:catechol 2,3-dioxygenase-like lactoylglutathione lyase family enzyme
MQQVKDRLLTSADRAANTPSSCCEATAHRRKEDNLRVRATQRAPLGVRKEGAQMAMPTLADWSLGTTIPAKDLDGTRRFYEDVLGAQIVMEDPGGIIYRSGDSYFSLYPTEFAGTAQHTLGAFMVGDVEAAVADLRGKGVTFEEYDMPGLKTVNGIAELGGLRGAWFKDPEGNILSVVQPPAA